MTETAETAQQAIVISTPMKRFRHAFCRHCDESCTSDAKILSCILAAILDLKAGQAKTRIMRN